MNIFKRFTDSFKTQTQNLFNKAFFSVIGNTSSSYDPNGKTYLKEGYQSNSFVYSIIQAQAKKTASIPYFIKKVDNETKARDFKREIKRSNITDPQTKIFLKNLENKAFVPGEDNMDFPLEKPNVSQSWTEFMAMYKSYMKLTGNCYIYCVSPDEGLNSGVPRQIYILPSHLIEIVVKQGANYLLDESPIDYYRLIEGTVFADFPSETVVHIKYPNPEFSLTGSHLYGQSPLKAALKNIESSNEAVNQNLKTMKNSGAFGIIHGKTQPLTPDQAAEIKGRLTEMDNDPSRLSNIAGVSAEIGFTRMSLPTKDLMPFDFLRFDRKEIASCLNWMLIDSTTSDYGGTIKEIKKENVVADIMPDLGLFEEAFTPIIQKFKGYKNTMLVFDASTLPEMQADMSTLTNWLSTALLDGTINRNEYREALNYPVIENNQDFERYTTKMGIVALEETFVEPEEIEPIEDEKKNLVYKAGFDPNQPRDKDGQWGSGSGTSKDPKGFEDSKVRDKDGNLIKVYHGTPKGDFEKFDLDFERSTDDGWLGWGAYFHPDKDVADVYSGSDWGNPKGFVKEAYLNIKNPFSFVGKSPYDLKQEHGGAKGLTKYLISQGYDGATNGFEWVVFDANQINLIN